MRFQNEIEVAAPPDELFAFVSDVERVAPCLPGAAGLLVALDEAHLALVGPGDRADLDLHTALVLVAVAAVDRRAGQARGDAHDVGDERELLVRRRGDLDLVLESHPRP